jgi:membrane dipeptidase
MHRRNLLQGGLCLLAQSAACLAEESRAYSVRTIDLVAQTNVLDMLSLPTLNWSLLDRWHAKPETFTESEFNRLRASGINVFHPAVAFDTAHPYEVTRSWFDKWNRLIAYHPGYFVRIDSTNDLQRAKRERKIGIILGMQDANHLRTKDDVDTFYAMGQRLAQLTYNSQNRLGDGCKVGSDRGLSVYGQEVVARMNAVGMAIDISHCGERTSLDAIAASAKPVLITHSNCRALAPPVARCKSDAVIRAAARKGGVIGMTSVRHFVRSTDPVTIEDVLDHFDHAVKLVGIEHVGLGSDTDLTGRDPAGSRPLYDIAGLNHTQRVYDLTAGLVRRGYTDTQIRLLLGGNFQRALSGIWT